MADKTLAIIGAGDLGVQIAHYAIQDNHYKNVVFFDDFTNGVSVHDFSVIGKTRDVEKFYKQELFHEIVIGIGYKHLEKRKIFYDLFIKKIPFGKIVHSSSWIDPSSIVEEGCIIYPSCSLDINTRIGANTIVNNGCTVAHNSEIGKHCFISPRAALAGFVKIGNMCNIGINSTIIDNIRIPEKTRLGGGTVVIRDISKIGVYVGNPARLIK